MNLDIPQRKRDPIAFLEKVSLLPLSKTRGRVNLNKDNKLVKIKCYLSLYILHIYGSFDIKSYINLVM